MLVKFLGSPMLTATPVSALTLRIEMLSGRRPSRLAPESPPRIRMLYLPLLGLKASVFLKVVEVKLDAARAVDPIVPAT